MKRFLIIILFVAFLFQAGCSGRKKQEGEFALINMANQEVAEALVKVCGQKFQIEALKQKEKRIFHFQITSDSHYDIQVKFISDKSITKKLGYITNGLDVKDSLIIKDDDIILESNTTVKK